MISLNTETHLNNELLFVQITVSYLLSMYIVSSYDVNKISWS